MSRDLTGFTRREEWPREATVMAWTDGSCYYKDRLGGWAFVGYTATHYIRSYGSAEDTTVNRMELTAILKLLRSLEPEGVKKSAREGEEPSVLVHTDSTYARDALTTNYDTWERWGWDTVEGEAVKNRDLIKEARGLADGLREEGVAVFFKWIKGHQKLTPGNHTGYYNHLADSDASSARKSQREDFKKVSRLG